MVTPCMLGNLHTHLPKLSGTSWSFYILVRIRSANCQAISTETDTTQVCHVWRTQRHRGCDWHSEGIEMLQWSSILICSFLKVSCQCLSCAVWVESVVDAGVQYQLKIRSQLITCSMCVVHACTFLLMRVRMYTHNVNTCRSANVTTFERANETNRLPYEAKCQGKLTTLQWSGWGWRMRARSTVLMLNMS